MRTVPCVSIIHVCRRTRCRELEAQVRLLESAVATSQAKATEQAAAVVSGAASVDAKAEVPKEPKSAPATKEAKAEAKKEPKRPSTSLALAGNVESGGSKGKSSHRKGAKDSPRTTPRTGGTPRTGSPRAGSPRVGGFLKKGVKKKEKEEAKVDGAKAEDTKADGAKAEDAGDADVKPGRRSMAQMRAMFGN
jgi:hypothetical protein